MTNNHSTAYTRNRPRRRALQALAIIAIVLLIALAGYWLAHRTSVPTRGRFFGRRSAAVSNMAMPVGTAKVISADIPVYLDALGTVTPLRTVTVRSLVSGELLSVAYTEGQHVDKGDLLAQVDPRPYQAQLRQAEGALARDQALLANARLDLARYKEIVKSGVIPKQQADTQQALVQQYEGTVKADQGNIDAARLNLSYCRITAPLSGRTGLRQVDPGNYIQAGDANGIVVITQLKPIDVLFTIPEDSLSTVLGKLHAGVKLEVDAFDRSKTKKIATGLLASLDNQVDTSTGTLKAKAEFANDDESLFPNQFVNVRVLIDTLHNATVVPSTALQRGADGMFVFLVQPDHSVTQRKLVTGPADGDRVAVISGLKPGDLVVTDGADKLREGSKVQLPGEAPPVPAGKAGAKERRGDWRGHKPPTKNGAQGGKSQ